MRRLPPSSALLWCLVGSNAAVSQITVCENFSSCRTFSSEEDANRYMEEAAKKRSDQEQEIIRSMPIDYRDCILVALLDEIPKQKTEHIYLDRLDMHLRRQLERNGVNVFPGTAEPRSALVLTNRTQHDVAPDPGEGRRRCRRRKPICGCALARHRSRRGACGCRNTSSRPLR